HSFPTRRSSDLVPRGVEELLGDDRRAQPHAGERVAAASLPYLLVALEELPGRGDVELDHLVVGDPPYPAGTVLAVVEGHEFHAGSPGRRARKTRGASAGVAWQP